LRRFYARHRAETRPVDLDLAKLLAPQNSKDPFEGATESLVTDWAFQLATNPRRNVSAFKALSRWILKQKEQQQRDHEIRIITERLALEREKFQFNAARQALLHHAELAKIMQNPATDNEDKINAAREQLFGIKPGGPGGSRCEEAQTPSPLRSDANNQSSIINNQSPGPSANQ
jgi:hypothetical protein